MAVAPSAGRTLERRFSQVDVFTTVSLRGNPLAVVHDAVDVSDEQMAHFANWTNLSETTFLLPPTDPAADYRVRIFTPTGELPFAGHPTLGSCSVWLKAGGVPKHPHVVVQQCGVGLVRIKIDGERLAFAAPPLLKSGPPTAEERARVCKGLALADEESIQAMEWVDNGPGFLGVLLPSAKAVLDVRPDWAALHGFDVGLVGPYPEGSECQFEVRALCAAALASSEDPVTGSLNAGVAQWLMRIGRAPECYVASQGTVLRRAGRVHVAKEGSDVWVGGHVTHVITGTVRL